MVLYPPADQPIADGCEIFNGLIKLFISYPSEALNVLYHCQLLYMGALALRAMHPKIPPFGTGPETNVGAELGQWYRYWIEVLCALKSQAVF
jgi:hypothetical protein